MLAEYRSLKFTLSDSARSRLACLALGLGIAVPFLLGTVIDRTWPELRRGIVRGNESIDRMEAFPFDDRFDSPDSRRLTTRIRYIKDDTGRIHLRTQRRLRNVVLLDSHPPIIERGLLKGRWIIFVFSLLNSQNLFDADTLIEFDERMSGIRLALRPTMHFAETSDWLPGHTEEMTTWSRGLWILLEEGKILRWTGGHMTPDGVLEFARQ